MVDSKNRTAILNSTMAPMPIWRVLTVVLSSIFLLSAWRWIGEDYAAIRYVRLEGNFQFVDQNEIENKLMPLVKNGLASLNLDEVSQHAKSIPWIDEVQVERIWPDTLILRLKEHWPQYRWGRKGLLSASGTRFDPRNLANFAELPAIFAADGNEARMHAAVKRMQHDLSGFGLKITELEVSERLAWTVKLKGGIELKLGRRRPIEMFGRFVGSIPLLGQHRIDGIRRVDLRYPNGYAIALKPDAIIQWNSELAPA